MLSYALRRLLGLVPVLMAVILLTFATNHLTPGDPVATMLGDQSATTTTQQQSGASRLLERGASGATLDTSQFSSGGAGGGGFGGR